LQLKGRPLAAVREYERAAAITGPEAPIIAAKLARMWLALGRLSEAKEAIERALPVAPDYVLNPLLLGEIALREGDHEVARTHLERVLQINPFDIQVHGLLATTYTALGQSELAAREAAAQTTLDQHLRAKGERP
jgi:tetratricopeptide (TPR) repeat protein